MNKELFNALRALEEEKGIPQAYMIEKIEAALVSAYKKEYGNNTNVRVVIDPAKDDIKVYQQKTVVEEIVNPQTEISLEDARKYSKRHTIGKVIDIEVKPKNFRRLSAMAAKNKVFSTIIIKFQIRIIITDFNNSISNNLFNIVFGYISI